MARDHARIDLEIWNDDDFRELSPRAQHLYFVLLTSPTLSYCGVCDWRPSRIIPLAGGWTRDGLEAAAEELAERLYIVVDEDTEEVLVRSFIRNDGLMKQPKMAVAMAKAFAGVASKSIRGVIAHELKRLHADQPDLNGWGEKWKAAELLSKDSLNPSDYPTGYPSRKGSGKGIEKGKSSPFGKGSTKGPSTPTPSPTPLLPTPKDAPAEPDAAKPQAIEQEITVSAYERLDKGFNFMAVRQIVKWAIHEKGSNPASVEAAIVGLYEMGKPITRQTVGQYLDGKIRQQPNGIWGGSTTRPDAPRDSKSGLLVER